MDTSFGAQLLTSPAVFAPRETFTQIPYRILDFFQKKPLKWPYLGLDGEFFENSLTKIVFELLRKEKNFKIFGNFLKKNFMPVKKILPKNLKLQGFGARLGPKTIK